MNFHKICMDNDPAVRNAFDGLCALLEDAERVNVLAFAEFVQRDGRIGVNARPMVLLDFLSRGVLRNIHEWAAHVASRGGVSARRHQ